MSPLLSNEIREYDHVTIPEAGGGGVGVEVEVEVKEEVKNTAGGPDRCPTISGQEELDRGCNMSTVSAVL